MKRGNWRDNKILALLLIILTPVVSICLMEGITGNLLTLSKAGLLLDVMISYGILAVLILIFKKVNTAAILQMILLIILALVQYYVYRFRGRSFTLSDLRTMGTAMEVAGNYSYTPEIRVVVCMIITVIWTIAISMLASICWKGFRIIRILLAVGICAGCFSFLSNKEMVRKHASLKLEMWNIDNEYCHKGVLLMLASEVQYLTVDKPENYSVEKVEMVAAENTSEYQKKENSKQDRIMPENLILIMNESLADLRIFGTYEDQMNVMPNIDNLESRNGSVYKGYLQVPVYGGGTANTEYVVLTGNSMEFWDNWTMAYQVYNQSKEYGMASILKKQGYDTMAMHPENPLNYNRKAVYASMDFNDFISRENWDENYLEKLRKYVDDQSCYEYLKQLTENKSSDKVFIFLLTMQNHSPYQTKKFDATISLETDQDYPQAEEYLTTIQESDRAFGKLIESFQEVEEPTMIVLFGDHMPNLLDGFYDELRSKSSLEPQEFSRRQYRTPYVIWTNYKMDISNIPLMSANYFGNYILQSIGADLSDYNKMSLNVLEQIPVINENEVMTADGTWLSIDSLSGEQKKLLNDYEIMQYNEVFGNGSRIDAVFE